MDKSGWKIQLAMFIVQQAETIKAKFASGFDFEWPINVSKRLKDSEFGIGNFATHIFFEKQSNFQAWLNLRVPGRLSSFMWYFKINLELKNCLKNSIHSIWPCYRLKINRFT